ncbi:hypothetical protein DEU56DRAFT_900808 [Suillus clintonianus]|uniref:uncharacterized protein n=1 Tax=Suillus clintonianus TaxID=1904413 RepID=UPI001B863F4F|nr:uncharacterized protein DEU56DRAFT_900808 [Suillus clintonianus]KAG2140592.1 hypothetical protein DEU56DRAFT_900808 [Suillus clintonianus]
MAAIPSFRRNLWPRHCLPSARDLVRSIVVSSKSPLSTKDIYHLALKQTAIQLVSDESPEHNVPKKEHPTIVRGMLKQPSTRPPHPEHAVRSLQYLKRVVLPDLVNSKEIEKFCTKRTLSQAEIDHRLQTVTKAARKEQSALLAAPRNTWLWKTRTPPPPLKPLPVSTLSKSELLGLPRLTAADVGVGEDWSHLNKRRRRARKEKVERDLKWMWTLQAAKREAAREVLQLSAPAS